MHEYCGCEQVCRAYDRSEIERLTRHLRAARERWPATWRSIAYAELGHLHRLLERAA